MSHIVSALAREILDSRGNPTVEVELQTSCGIVGRAAVPSGASTGQFEAYELRDGDKARYFGKGVKKAVENIHRHLAPAIKGLSVFEQQTIDTLLCEIDNSSNKQKLGANALLGVSLATAKVGAAASGLPLYRYLGGVNSCRLPIPLMNVINGGAHADNNLDIQEFMIVPWGAKNFPEALRWGVEVFHTLKSFLKSKGHSTSIGDEGGFAPNLESHTAALEALCHSIEKAGFTLGKDIALALDVAASELYENGIYTLKSENKKFSSPEMVEYLRDLVKKFPIISIEDGLHEEDWEGFINLTSQIGKTVQIVGDDLYVTNTSRLKTGLEKKASNAILIKPNQIGTLTETLQCIRMAQHHGWKTIVSHRSGETEDTTIADIAVALNCGQIKTGSLCRSDRVSKYNQLLRISEELGKNAQFYW